MKRVWGHVLAGLSLLAGSAVGFSACVHDDSTIFIRDVLAPQFSQSGMPCSFTADPMQAVISSGVLDIALRVEYDAEYLLANQMVAQVNSSQLQTETSTVNIQGAIVRITNAAGVQLSTFTRLTAGTIYPASGNVPGYASINVAIIDAGTILKILSNPNQNIGNAPLGASGYVRLVTYVRFFGQSLGGQSVESNEFEFPVDVCNGCLVNFTNNPTYPTPNCVGNPTSGTSTVQPHIPCFIGQDLAVDCSVVCESIPTCNANNQAAAGAPDAGGG